MFCFIFNPWLFSIFLFFYFRITAYAQLASALTGELDSAIFHPNLDKVVEEFKQCKKEQTIKENILDETKKEYMALQEVLTIKNKEIDSLTKINSELTQDLSIEEKKIVSFKMLSFIVCSFLHCLNSSTTLSRFGWKIAESISPVKADANWA